jgi:hypothetical protein
MLNGAGSSLYPAEVTYLFSIIYLFDRRRSLVLVIVLLAGLGGELGNLRHTEGTFILFSSVIVPTRIWALTELGYTQGCYITGCYMLYRDRLASGRFAADDVVPLNHRRNSHAFFTVLQAPFNPNHLPLGPDKNIRPVGDRGW